ncbi:unnamed protein product [Arabidopsis lyrata]|nr:unnamed protein product [Arabidopsis lyrata]
MMRPLMNLRPVVSQVGRCMGSRRNDFCSASTSDKEVEGDLWGIYGNPRS